jgi:hypothetical protein
VAHGARSSGGIPHPRRPFEIRGQCSGCACVREKFPHLHARALPTEATQADIVELVRALSIGPCDAEVMVVSAPTPASIMLPHLSDHLFNYARGGTSRKSDEEIVIVSERNLFVEAEGQHERAADENRRQCDAGLSGEDLSENAAFASPPRRAGAEGYRHARRIDHPKRPVAPSTIGAFLESGHLHHELGGRPAIIRVQEPDVRSGSQRQACVPDRGDVTRVCACHRSHSRVLSWNISQAAIRGPVVYD